MNAGPCDGDIWFWGWCGLIFRFQSHFESIQRISDSTTLPSVLPHLKARLFALVDLSGLTEKLILGKEDPQALSSRDKMQLWQELKTLSVFPSQLSVRLHTHTSINPLFFFNLPRIPFEQTLMSTVSYDSCLFFKLGGAQYGKKWWQGHQMQVQLRLDFKLLLFHLFRVEWSYVVISWTFLNIPEIFLKEVWDLMVLLFIPHEFRSQRCQVSGDHVPKDAVRWMFHESLPLHIFFPCFLGLDIGVIFFFMLNSSRRWGWNGKLVRAIACSQQMYCFCLSWAGFTRTVCAMWAVSLLDIFIRIQLNILGRHVYIDTAWDLSKLSVSLLLGLSLCFQFLFFGFLLLSME